MAEYDSILKEKKKVKDTGFISSTIKYLESNARFNLFEIHTLINIIK